MSEERAHQRAYHVIYKTTCEVTGRYYIGMHSTNNLNDGYIGSGQRLWRSIKKYGKEQHHCQILEHLEDRKSLSIREAQIVNKDLLKDPQCMNLRTGGTGFIPGTEITKITREKMGVSGKTRWARERIKLKMNLEERITNLSLSREEILKALIQPNGKLNKNATRALLKLQANKLAGQFPSVILKKRDKLVHAKWSFVLSQLQNPVFRNDLVEQIDAFVNERTTRPTCKICSTPTTFFRFGHPYAVYCGARCQLNDITQKNPVLSRWAKNK